MTSIITLFIALVYQYAKYLTNIIGIVVRVPVYLLDTLTFISVE